MNLKGQCRKIFLLLVFFMNQFSPAPEYPIRTVSDFFKNSQKYSQVKVHHGYQWHRWQNCRRYQRHWQQIFHCYQQHQRAANFATSLASVVDTSGKIATGVNNTSDNPYCIVNHFIKRLINNCVAVSLNFPEINILFLCHVFLEYIYILSCMRVYVYTALHQHFPYTIYNTVCVC